MTRPASDRILVTTLHRSLRFPHQETRRILRCVVRGERKRPNEIGVAFVNDRRMRTLNRRYLSHDWLTDVISFSYGTSKVREGEIVVNLDQARRQARTFGVSYREEVARLIVHGMLHICGYRDNTVRRQKTMRHTEDRYLQSLYA